MPISRSVLSSALPSVALPYSAEPPDAAAEFQDLAILGESEAMQMLRLQVHRIGPHFRTVLIRGEIGTGKEMIARALHNASSGSTGPFAVCYAATLDVAVPDAVVHERIQEFAQKSRNGTLFIDGVDKLPPSAQTFFLSEISQRSIRRLIVSTSEDLRGLVAFGRFSRELYQVIATVDILLPPLAERREDIPLLATHYLREFNKIYGRHIRSISDEAMERMKGHSWPGNIRELENVVRNAVLQCDGSILQAGDLTSLCELKTDSQPPRFTATPVKLQDVVGEHVQYVLKSCAGNKVKTAKMLGVSRSTLYRMLEDYSTHNPT
ncbi:MAG: sigma 54-interacting transcriptional regulator [Acidobacteriaceae bacterium]|nr:sigma 54-interacting transcriptional regulator [Acidobacteriaceae bacterium]